MYVIAFVSQKGGVGKSTLALNVAIAAEADGEVVAILDADRQGTVADWYDVRTCERPIVIRYSKPASDLQAAIAALATQGFTIVIIDTKGEDDLGTRAAMLASDLCLSPVRPSGPDLNACGTTLDALAAMGRDFAIVLNQTSPNKATKATGLILSGLSRRATVVPQVVATRMAFQHAYAHGQAASEFEPDGKAGEEIKALWAWCRKRLQAEKGELHRGKEKRRRTAGDHRSADRNGAGP
jgi:chromosome partitioning protein